MRARSNVTKWMAAVVAVAAMAACTDDGATKPPASAPTTSGSTPTTGPSTTSPGGSDGPASFSGIRLAKGTAPSAPSTGNQLVTGTPLDDGRLATVVGQLPPWSPPTATAEAFEWPTQSLQPPAAPTTQQPFPSGTDRPPAPTPATGPLHVLRSQPIGDIAVAPFASITFDQPMVPVATVGQLAAADVPATITPDVPGTWQWIGTSTLRFDASAASTAADPATGEAPQRLPMATHYTITVPAGTTSATGGALADSVSFEFVTPPAKVRSLVPDSDDLPLTPVFVATFDQRVDPAAVLAVTTVTAGGNDVAIRQATPDEIAADTLAQQTVDASVDRRWVAFRTTAALAPDTRLSIAIGPSIPSLEGPDANNEVATYDVATYAPLRVDRSECGYGDGCHPGDSFTVTFNNLLDPQRFDPTKVTIEPALPGATIGMYGNVVNVYGATAANTTYAVSFPADLTDVHGQQLGTTTTTTFDVGDPVPYLQPFAHLFTTLDPFAATPTLPVVSVGHRQLRVRVYAVEPGDWEHFPEQLSQTVYRDPSQPEYDLPFQLLDDRTVDVSGQLDVVSTTELELGDQLAAHGGNVVVRVDVDGGDQDRWSPRTALTWVQSTQLGLNAVADATTVHAYVSDLRTGAPVAGAVVDLPGTGATATTGADGQATLELGPGAALLRANADGQQALLPASEYGSRWQQTPLVPATLFYAFPDRGVYRAGETVSIKGFVRRVAPDAPAHPALPGPSTVTFTATDQMGNAIASGDATADPLGGFHFTIDLPEGTNSGPLFVNLAAGQDMGSTSVLVEDYRTPEFEVTAAAATDGPYLRSAPITLSTTASYYSGGPLPSAPVDWQVRASSASYDPPGWDGFQFGRWSAWWLGGDDGARPIVVGGGANVGADGLQHATGTTDGNGQDHLQVDVGSLGGDEDGYPVTITAQSTVTDVNRQAWSSSTSVLVHPADRYVGLRGTSTFVDRGTPLATDVIVTDVDGNVIAGVPVTVVASRMESQFRNGTWTSQPTDPQTCTVTSASTPVSCEFATTKGGELSIEARVTDDQGRESRTTMSRWVAGETDPTASRSVQQQQLTLIPDAREYAPGDTAQVLVQAPFAAGEGVLAKSVGTKVTTIRFTVVDGSATVPVPIDDDDVAGVQLTVSVVGAAPRVDAAGAAIDGAPARPAVATGTLPLRVSLASRTLTVHAVPQSAELQPGASTKLDVDVTDANGQPVTGSDLAIVVVDEAVLALSGYELADPLDTFYGNLPGYLTANYGAASVVLADPSAVLAGQPGDGAGRQGAAAATTAAAAGTVPAGAPTAGGAPTMDSAVGESKSSLPMAGAAGQAPSVDVRTSFAALAMWSPSVQTDAAGRATVDVQLPDNLTRYRVMVVAAAGAEQFGTAEANITATLPLMVRPSAPRFANFGDRFELPVVVQNQTASAMQVDVVVQTGNLDLTGPAGVRVDVPANDRVEVRFPLATASAGTADVRVAAIAVGSPAVADAATVSFPVYTPATAEAFATYGVLDDGATEQPVATPDGVIAQFGGLDVTTSSTALAGLTDALAHVVADPYRSADSLSMQIITIAALRDVAAAFAAPDVPSPAALDAIVRDDLDELVALQNPQDGGFGWWRGGESSPYVSLQAARALVTAKSAGYTVSEAALQQALGYAGTIEQHLPAEWDETTRCTLQAEALSVRGAAGDRQPGQALALTDSCAGSLTLGAEARLWPLLDDASAAAAIERDITNAAVDTAGAVSFTTAVSDDANVTLASDQRTDAQVLDALLAERPDSDLVPKAVTGLLADRDLTGAWSNIESNAAALIALRHYFDAFEQDDPAFTAGVWVGDRFAGDQSFDGRSTNRNLLTVPTAELVGGANADVTIGHEGTGRLYYRIGLRTAPSDLQLAPLDRGFVVQRSYEAVDDPGDVRRDPDGTWHVKAGARVRVRLTMVAESQRAHAALVDPLPAGFEAQNPALAVTQPAPADPTSPGMPIDSAGGVSVATTSPVGPAAGSAAIDRIVEGWWGRWYDHENLLDDRVEVFATSLGGGVYDYSYLARATTPGTFITPPTRAEEIYSPETFGRGASATVVVEG